MWRFAESKLAWFGATVAALAAFVVATALWAPKTRTLVDEGMQVHAIATAAAWQANSRTARCPRTPLREPTVGDGSRFLEPLVDKDSVEVSCLKHLGEVYFARYAGCQGNAGCVPVKLAGIEDHPDLIARCAVLYDDIERVAHASDACSPTRAGTWDLTETWTPPVFRVVDAVRLQIAPLVRRGDLAGAARHVTDAMRFGQDFGRHTSLLGAALGSGMAGQLLETLDEILVDPRLSRDDARAIARDLDVLIATMPSFVDAVHGEAAWFPSLLASFQTPHITDDLGQDYTLYMLGRERMLDEFDRVCGTTPLRTCTVVFGVTASHSDDWDDFDPLTRSFDDDATVRERVLDKLAREFLWAVPDYARSFARRHVSLLARRMQAELRTMDDCRFDRLAPWLPDGTTVETDGTLRVPDWIREDHPSGEPYRLRCVP